MQSDGKRCRSFVVVLRAVGDSDVRRQSAIDSYANGRFTVTVSAPAKLARLMRALAQRTAMSKYFAIGVGLLIVAGCRGTNNQSSPLVGSWLTDACSQMTESNGDVLDIWGRGVYQFYANGAVVPRARLYSDSSCSGNFELLSQLDVSNTPFSFEDCGEEALEEGVDGGRLIFSIVVDGEMNDIEGFYYLNDGVLCLSDNINLEPFAISSSSLELESIDFEKCLSRLN